MDVDFWEANLTGANFGMATLTGASLADANFRGGKLREVDIDFDSPAKNVRFCRTVIPDRKINHHDCEA